MLRYDNQESLWEAALEGVRFERSLWSSEKSNWAISDQAVASQAQPETPRERGHPASDEGLARAQLEKLAAWRKDAEGTPLLATKRAALHERVRTLAAVELDALRPEKLLRGKLVQRKDGQATLTYEFDDPRELEDFSSENYQPLVREALGRIKSADEPFHVEKGRLVGCGQVWLRSLVDFSAPLVVRYTVEFVDTEVEKPRCTWGLGVCADGPGHFLLAIDRHALECYDLTENPSTSLDLGPTYTRTVYTMELRHDGAKATLLMDGKPQCSLGVGTRQSGAFFLGTSTDNPMQVERLEIEGRLTDSCERLKRTRIEQELARF